MFRRLRQRLRDMSTISQLCRGAERHALADQQQKPGAEHFLLAAFELPDGTAQRVFGRLSADPAGVRPAIMRQYDEALGLVGAEADQEPSVPARPGLYDAAPSGQALMRALAALPHSDRPLLGADVLTVVAAMEHGVAARTIRAMGLDRAELGRAAATEIAAG